MAGSTLGNAYSPTSLVTTVRAALVSSLTMTTSAPGITPCASRTRPRMAPWYDCAYAGAETIASRSVARSAVTPARAHLQVLIFLLGAMRCGTEGAQTRRVPDAPR